MAPDVLQKCPARQQSQLDAVVSSMNKSYKTVETAYPSFITLVNLYSSFTTPGMIRPDCIHPNNQGHTVIKDLFKSAIADYVLTPTQSMRQVVR